MKIISGGQTGSDLGGLQGAHDAGLRTGGTAPKGYKTEKGNNFELRDIYKLSEDSSSDYSHRTLLNIMDADWTIVFADKIDSAGTRLTISICEKYKKPYLINPSIDGIRAYVSSYKPNIINVAGNRESVAPGIQERTRKIIKETFENGI